LYSVQIVLTPLTTPSSLLPLVPTITLIGVSSLMWHTDYYRSICKEVGKDKMEQHMELPMLKLSSVASDSRGALTHHLVFRSL
jgi:hypothetical protein